MMGTEHPHYEERFNESVAGDETIGVTEIETSANWI